jgi:hypothetical protein
MRMAGVKATDDVQTGHPHGAAVDVDAQVHSNVLVVPVGEDAAVGSALLDAIVNRAAAGAAAFYVILPDPAAHAELTAAQRRDSHALGMRSLERALAQLSAATGSAVEGAVSIRHDPMDVIEEALLTRAVDEIMLALARHPFAERLHIDLSARVAHFGLPVTTVTLDTVDRGTR